MDRQLMLSWLATQSRNAPVTPTDMYQAKLGAVNEGKASGLGWAGLATGMIAAPALMAGMHGHGPSIPNPPTHTHVHRGVPSGQGGAGVEGDESLLGVRRPTAPAVTTTPRPQSSGVNWPGAVGGAAVGLGGAAAGYAAGKRAGKAEKTVGEDKPAKGSGVARTIAGLAAAAALHGSSPTPPSKPQQVPTAAQQTVETPASGRSDAPRMPLTLGGAFDTRRGAMPGQLTKQDLENMLRDGPPSKTPSGKMPEDGLMGGIPIPGKFNLRRALSGPSPSFPRPSI